MAHPEDRNELILFLENERQEAHFICQGQTPDEMNTLSLAWSSAQKSPEDMWALMNSMSGFCLNQIGFRDDLNSAMTGIENGRRYHPQ